MKAANPIELLFCARNSHIFFQAVSCPIVSCFIEFCSIVSYSNQKFEAYLKLSKMCSAFPWKSPFFEITKTPQLYLRLPLLCWVLPASIFYVKWYVSPTLERYSGWEENLPWKKECYWRIGFVLYCSLKRPISTSPWKTLEGLSVIFTPIMEGRHAPAPSATRKWSLSCKLRAQGRDLNPGHPTPKPLV